MIGTEWSFGSVLWLTVVLMFWTMVIWIFIGVFADLFRRNTSRDGRRPVGSC